MGAEPGLTHTAYDRDAVAALATREPDAEIDVQHPGMVTADMTAGAYRSALD